MFKFKNFAFVILCLAILMFSSCIYAGDVNGTASDMSQHQICDNNACGSFVDLNDGVQKLNAGDVFNIQKDYCFADKSSIEVGCITIGADNITINGNNHCLNGNNHQVTFKITGNNVKILNLTICNCQGFGEDLKITVEGNPVSTSYSTCMSPVNWKGDNGTVENCIFIGNGAVNGGAISWSGDNGIINNTCFINNSARGAGGSVYISGRNNNISNTIFVNSTSQLVNESVYLDRKHESFYSNNITCDNIFCFNGAVIGADVNNLRKTYYSQFAGEEINLIPMIYSSLFTLQCINSTCYFGVFSSELQTYTLSLIRNFDEYNITYENDYVISAKDLNDVFSCLMSDKYTVNFRIVKNWNVNNLNDYLDVCHADFDNNILKTPVIDIVEKDMDIVHNFEDYAYILNVNFKENGYFASNEQWIENNGFNLTLINGNGATVHAASDDRDENKWIVNKNNLTYSICNLTIDGFNNAIVNLNGTCVFNGVHFNNNRMDYRIDRDEGAAILNAGCVVCINCTFTNNYAKNGGAIFSQGLLILENCTFKNNTAYGIGDDVLNVDAGIVMMDGELINGSKGPVKYEESISKWQVSLITLINILAISTFSIFAAASVIVTCGATTAFAVGSLVALVSIATLGSYSAYTVASQDYDLNSNRKAIFLTFTAGVTVEVMQNLIFAMSMLPIILKNPPRDVFMSNGKKSVLIEGKVCPVEDTFNVNGKFYSKEQGIVKVDNNYYKNTGVSYSLSQDSIQSTEGAPNLEWGKLGALDEIFEYKFKTSKLSIKDTPEVKKLLNVPEGGIATLDSAKIEKYSVVGKQSNMDIYTLEVSYVISGSGDVLNSKSIANFWFYGVDGMFFQLLPQSSNFVRIADVNNVIVPQINNEC